jgi:hypothetical protein
MAILALGATRTNAESALLPDLWAHLQAARYAPGDVDLRHEAWIGAGADVVRFEGTTAYFTSALETILGNTLRAFEARQANYHLEVGARRSFGDHEVGVFFHHVSRHEQDRPKPEAVDWNLLGLRASTPLPKEFFFPTRITFSIARATRTSFVEYQWEATGRVESDVLTRRWGQAYLDWGGRLVTSERTLVYPRSGFLDFQAEAGVRFQREERMLELFVAFDHRNDVLITQPLTKSRALFGFRIGAGRRSPAAGPSALP